MVGFVMGIVALTGLIPHARARKLSLARCARRREGERLEALGVPTMPTHAARKKLDQSE